MKVTAAIASATEPEGKRGDGQFGDARRRSLDVLPPFTRRIDERALTVTETRALTVGAFLFDAPFGGQAELSHDSFECGDDEG